VPRGVRALEWFTATFGTDLFGKTGGAIFFAVFGIFITWVAALSKDGETMLAMLRRRKEDARQNGNAKPANPSISTVPAEPAHSGFGRKRVIGAPSNPPSTYLDDLPDTIDVTSAEDVAWLKGQSNPSIWHEAAAACVVYVGDRHGFLPWLIEQPNMDRTTAGLIFVGVGGPRYLKDRYYHSAVNHEDMEQILQSLCLRSESIGFVQDSIGFEDFIWSHYETERQACLEIISKNMIVDGLIAPHKILNSPFLHRTKKAEYCDIGEGELVTDKYLIETLPQIYGKNGPIALV
jgi:hypothetical protein